MSRDQMLFPGPRILSGDVDGTLFAADVYRNIIFTSIATYLSSSASGLESGLCA